MVMTGFEIVGLIGFAAYLGAFGALQFRLISGDGVMYTAMNIFGASLVLISLLGSFNLASALIQISWILIGLCGLGLRVFRRTARRGR